MQNTDLSENLDAARPYPNRHAKRWPDDQHRCNQHEYESEYDEKA